MKLELLQGLALAQGLELRSGAESWKRARALPSSFLIGSSEAAYEKHQPPWTPTGLH